MIKSLIIGTVILIMTWLVLRSNVAELKKHTDQYKLKKRQRTLKTINKLIKHMEINTDELIIGSQRLAGS